MLRFSQCTSARHDRVLSASIEFHFKLSKVRILFMLFHCSQALLRTARGVGQPAACVSTPIGIYDCRLHERSQRQTVQLLYNNRTTSASLRSTHGEFHGQGRHSIRSTVQCRYIPSTTIGAAVSQTGHGIKACVFRASMATSLGRTRLLRRASTVAHITYTAVPCNDIQMLEKQAGKREGVRCRLKRTLHNVALYLG